ncbi:MAG: DedA family protein [Myxococcales bacterium]|nr:MAG: DedA family protein [Myxococcales bacterium]
MMWIELVSHASLALIVLALIATGLGLPLPEDILLLLAGALCHRSHLFIPWTILGCALGVLGGDILLFSTAKHLGSKALDKALFRKLLPKQRQARISAMFQKRGAVIIFVARHLAGIRAAVFAMAGMHGMLLKKFMFWDMLGMCISVPLMVSLGYLFSEHLDLVQKGVSSTEHWLASTAVIAILGFLMFGALSRKHLE